LNNKTTLFSYLYNALTTQIKIAKYKYGESLPSYRKLCEIYNVGIRTVKDVLAVLREEGYIKTEERKDTIVIYKPSNKAEVEPIKELMAKREALLDCLKTMEIMMPDIFVRSMEVNSVEDWTDCRNDIKGVDQKPRADKWRIMSGLFRKILSNFNNPVLIDLYIDLDMFLQVTIFEGFKNPFIILSEDLEDQLMELISSFEKNKVEKVENYIKEIYIKTYKSMKTYLDAVAEAYPEFVGVPQRQFEWNAEKGKVFSYTIIARDLITRIGCGEFPDGSLLPSIAVLAKTYKASPYTIKEALTILSELGLVKVINGIGSQVTLAESKKAKINIKDSTMKRDYIIFLCALQYMAYGGRVAAPLAFKSVKKADIEKLEDDVHDTSKKSIPTMLTAYIIENLPYSTMRVIYGQIVSLVKWGYYFEMARTNNSHLAKIRELSIAAIESLDKGRFQEFGEKFSDIWVYILNVLKKAFIKFGINEAREIVVPGEARAKQ